jgi:hypothetical protein
MSANTEATFDVVFTDPSLDQIAVKAAYLTEEDDLVVFKTADHAYVAAVPKHHLLYATRRVD